MSHGESSFSRESRLRHLYVQQALNRVHDYSGELHALTVPDSDELVHLLGVSSQSKGPSVAAQMEGVVGANEGVAIQNLSEFVRSGESGFRTTGDGTAFQSHSLFRDIHTNPFLSGVSDMFGGQRLASQRMLLSTLPPQTSVFQYLKFIDNAKVPLSQRAYQYSVLSAAAATEVQKLKKAASVKPFLPSTRPEIVATDSMDADRDSLNEVYANLHGLDDMSQFLADALVSLEINAQDSYNRVSSSPSLGGVDVVQYLDGLGRIQKDTIYRHQNTCIFHHPLGQLPASMPAVVHGVILADLQYTQFALRFKPSLTSVAEGARLASFAHPRTKRRVLHFANILNLLAGLPHSTVHSMQFSASVAPLVHFRLLLASIHSLRTVDLSVQHNTRQYSAQQFLEVLQMHTRTVLQRQEVFLSVQNLRVLTKVSASSHVLMLPDHILHSKNSDISKMVHIYKQQIQLGRQQQSILHAQFVRHLLQVFRGSPVAVLAHSLAEYTCLSSGNKGGQHSFNGRNSYSYYTPVVPYQALQCLRFSGTLGSNADALISLLTLLSGRAPASQMHAEYNGRRYPFAGKSLMTRVASARRIAKVGSAVTTCTVKEESETVDCSATDIVHGTSAAVEYIRAGKTPGQSMYSLPVRSILEHTFPVALEQSSSESVLQHNLSSRERYLLDILQVDSTYQPQRAPPTQQTLDLSNSALSLQSLTGILLAAQQLSSLRAVVLNRTPLPRGVGAALASLLLHCDIRVLSCEAGLQSANLFELAKALPFCSLQQLNLSKTLFTAPEHQEYLCRGQQLNKSIRKLSLANCKLSPAALILVFQALQTHPTLTHLDISMNELTVHTIKPLVKLLSVNKTLSSLNLLSTGLTSTTLHLLADNMPASTALRRLNLAWNRFGSIGAPAVRKLQLGLPLTHLNMFHTKLEDAGVALLADALPQSHLTALDLSYNHLTMSSVNTLARVLWQCPRLVELNLTNNKDISPVLAKGSVFLTPGAPFGGILKNVPSLSLFLCLQQDSALLLFQKTLHSIVLSIMNGVYPLNKDTQLDTSQQVQMLPGEVLSVETSRIQLRRVLNGFTIDNAFQEIVPNINQFKLREALHFVLSLLENVQPHLVLYRKTYPAAFSEQDGFQLLFIRVYCCIQIFDSTTCTVSTTNTVYNTPFSPRNTLYNKITPLSLPKIISSGNICTEPSLQSAIYSELCLLPPVPVYEPFCNALYDNSQTMSGSQVKLSGIAGNLTNDPFLQDRDSASLSDSRRDLLVKRLVGLRSPIGIDNNSDKDEQGARRLGQQLELQQDTIELPDDVLRRQVCDQLQIIRRETEYARQVNASLQLMEATLTQCFVEQCSLDPVEAEKQAIQVLANHHSVQGVRAAAYAAKQALHIVQRALQLRLQPSLVHRDLDQISAYSRHLQGYQGVIVDMGLWSSFAESPALLASGVEQTCIGVTGITTNNVNKEYISHSEKILTLEEIHAVTLIAPAVRHRSTIPMLQWFYDAPLHDAQALQTYCDECITLTSQSRPWSWAEELDQGLLRYPAVSAPWLLRELNLHFGASQLDRTHSGFSLRDLIVPPRLYRPLSFTQKLPASILLPANHIQLCLARNAAIATQNTVSILLLALDAPHTSLAQAAQQAPSGEVAASVFAQVAKFLTPRSSEIPISFAQ